MHYRFDEPLIEGIIKSRPNRFLMEVEVGGKLLLCHCPVTGRIGDVSFSDIPCLLSLEEIASRRTNLTVEAISLDKASKKKKNWIAINQKTINNHINFFIKNNFLPKMKLGKVVRREVILNSSRIDFCVDEAYMEIKMSLLEIESGPIIKQRRTINLIHFKDGIDNLRI